MSAILYSTDLFFSSRVTGSAAAAGLTMSVAGTEKDLRDQLSENTDLVVIDLTVAAEISEAILAVRQAAAGARIIAFGPHVATNKLAAADQAGCDVVMTRGQFDQQLPTLFRT